MRLRVRGSSGAAFRSAALPTAVLALGGTGCASLTTSATEVGGVRMTDERPMRDGGSLTVAFKSDPDKLDPSLGSTLVGRSVLAAMCQKLYDTDARNHIRPQLAGKMPEVSDGGRKVVIEVRKGARFSDGTPLDAKAVETSPRRHRDLPESARAGELEPVQSIEAVGGDKVEPRLKEPYEPLLGALADRSGMVMSPRALKRYGKDFAAQPSCVGPFRFKQRVAGDRIVLEKDLGDRIAVMYLGEIVEVAPAAELFAVPKHPYTQALLSAVPVPDPPAQRARQRIVLEGDLTGPVFPKAGGGTQTVDHCRFHTRCPLAYDRCRTQAPEHRTLPGTGPDGSDGGRTVACHLVEDDGTAPRRGGAAVRRPARGDRPLAPLAATTRQRPPDSHHPTATTPQTPAPQTPTP
ncbi:oligopeptide/dipeptide ABC transporter ATP-binding protein [Streptomyces marispadix]|uniref:oligopeptide/dipeptide ABC transporter ATP-binding protein n=1 Tax=Streptomyces marispadix TaxID=2922868 RepID=UPI00240295EC|nr:oligopeptide/dipeptide ABC transporter ATP-binding protein [Streptomyces marispadix]